MLLLPFVPRCLDLESFFGVDLGLVFGLVAFAATATRSCKPLPSPTTAAEANSAFNHRWICLMERNCFPAGLNLSVEPPAVPLMLVVAISYQPGRSCAIQKDANRKISEEWGNMTCVPFPPNKMES